MPPSSSDDDERIAAALTAARRKKAREAKRTAAPRGPLPLTSARRALAPAARRSAGLLAVSDASSDADAAARLREWLASMAGAPKGSRWARHRAAVVTKALALLEARRTDAQEAELRALLASLEL